MAVAANWKKRTAAERKQAAKESSFGTIQDAAHELAPPIQDWGLDRSTLEEFDRHAPPDRMAPPDYNRLPDPMKNVPAQRAPSYKFPTPGEGTAGDIRGFRNVLNDYATMHEYAPGYGGDVAKGYVDALDMGSQYMTKSPTADSISAGIMRSDRDMRDRTQEQRGFSGLASLAPVAGPVLQRLVDAGSVGGNRMEQANADVENQFNRVFERDTPYVRPGFAQANDAADAAAGSSPWKAGLGAATGGAFGNRTAGDDLGGWQNETADAVGGAASFIPVAGASLFGSLLKGGAKGMMGAYNQHELNARNAMVDSAFNEIPFDAPVPGGGNRGGSLYMDDSLAGTGEKVRSAGKDVFGKHAEMKFGGGVRDLEGMDGGKGAADYYGTVYQGKEPTTKDTLEGWGASNVQANDKGDAYAYDSQQVPASGAPTSGDTFHFNVPTPNTPSPSIPTPSPVLTQPTAPDTFNFDVPAPTYTPPPPAPTWNLDNFLNSSFFQNASQFGGFGYLHDGGTVPQPGGDIPAILQGGEEVINANAAQKFRGLLKMINAQGYTDPTMRHFAAEANPERMDDSPFSAPRATSPSPTGEPFKPIPGPIVTSPGEERGSELPRELRHPGETLGDILKLIRQFVR